MIMYYMIHALVYTISVMLSMIGLSCFHFENYIKKGRVREFYVFYIVASVALGYLFGSFILSFVSASQYTFF